MTKMMHEDVFHVVRHMRGHIQELREKKLNKEKEYLLEIVDARLSMLELAHDMVYIMRERKYNGYENVDFSFDLRISEDIDLEKYEFQIFNFDSFRIIMRIENLLEFQEPEEISLSPEDAGEQMNTLNRAIVDMSVAIRILKQYYDVSENFDSIVI